MHRLQHGLRTPADSAWHFEGGTIAEEVQPSPFQHRQDLHDLPHRLLGRQHHSPRASILSAARELVSQTLGAALVGREAASRAWLVASTAGCCLLWTPSPLASLNLASPLVAVPSLLGLVKWRTRDSRNLSRSIGEIIKRIKPVELAFI
ncbi:hypothetical protein EJB05_45055, partial [Eragrostis curvula]